MPSIAQIRTRLLQKIQRVPTNKLMEIYDFVSKIEEVDNNTLKKKEKNLSFAGSWKYIDDNLFEDLTINLIKNRERNKRRLDE